MHATGEIQDEATVRLRALRDPSLPALADLLGPGALDMLDAAVPPASHHGPARLRRVSWRPGRSFTAMFERRSGDPAADDQVLVATTERSSDPAQAAPIRVWDRLDDPELPGLRAALAGPDLDAWLDAMGVEAGSTARRLVTYRPARRAVVEVRRADRRAFVKVVRPLAVAGIRERHIALGDSLPVPRLLGTSTEAGILVMQALDGETLFEALARGAVNVATGPVIELLDRIGRIPSTDRTVASPVERVDEHVRSIALILPDEAARLAAIAAAIGPEDRPASTMIHGDLHHGQILVRGDAVVGVLDLDTVGLGRPADDPANALAHLAAFSLSASPAASPPWLPATLTFADRLLRRFEAQHDPVDLRRRIAAALLGLAAAQFQSQVPGWPEQMRQRLHAAEWWLESMPADVLPHDRQMRMSSSAA